MSASALAVLGANPGDRASGVWIHDVPECVHGDQRRDDQPVGQTNRRGADARFHRPREAEGLSDRRARSRADVAFRDRASRRGRGGPISTVGVRPHVRVTHAEVEQDRRRHDRHLRDADVEAAPVLFEPAHGARRRVEAEGAAAGEHDCVDAIDGIQGIQQVGLARAGRRSAHVNGRDRGGLREDHRAAGRPRRERVVSNGQAAHGRERVVLLSLDHQWRRHGREEGSDTKTPHVAPFRTSHPMHLPHPTHPTHRPQFTRVPLSGTGGAANGTGEAWCTTIRH